MALTKVKAGNIILTTPSASSNDVTPATTQYVTTAINNLIDGAPATLNTLDEIAAALNDDAALNTTLTNAIAAKLPLAGGTLTGNLNVTGKIVAGDVNSTTGDVLLEGYYGNGATVVIGSERSSGGVFLGYGVQPSVTTQGQFLSSSSATLSQGAYVVSDTHKWYTVTAGSSVAVGSQLTTMTERMRILGNGKVGIGNDAPSEALDISYAAHGLYSQHRPSANVGTGQEMYYDFNTADGTREHYSSIYTEIESSTNGAESGKIALRAAKAGVMTSGITLIGSTGNVGIGTTSPSVNLEVIDPVSGNFAGAITVGGNGSNRRLILEQTDVLTYRMGGTGTNSITQLVSAGSAGTGTVAMTIDESQNVGIGTSAPVASTNKTVLGVQGVWGGQVDIMVGTAVHASFGTDNFASGQSARIQSQDGIIFKSGGSTERMRIDSTGNTQIGAPILTHIGGSKLFINKAVNAAPATSGTTQTGGALRLRGGDNAVLDMGMNSVNTWIQATDRANLANKYSLGLNPNGGKVGIGIISPDVSMEVDGPLKIRNNTAGGISQTHTNMSVGNSGKLIMNFASVGTMTTGDTIVFTYNAINWKSWFYKIRYSSTGGYMGELWAGGYNNNSDGYGVYNPKAKEASTSNTTTDGATLTVTRSGQTNTMTLTLNNTHIHPLFEIEYSCGGGEGFPVASRASITVNS